ncbi:MAG: CHASE2 domain-containing protein [Methylovirgula sp.]
MPLRQKRPPGAFLSRAMIWARGAGALCSALLLWLAPTALGLVLCLTSPPVIERLRNLVFDHDQIMQPRHYDADAPVRVVDIDDASLAHLGQWPWPHQRLAELTDHLQALGAAAIAFDVLFAEDDRTAPANLLGELPALPERDAFLKALATSGVSGTKNFAQAIAKVPTVLAFVMVNNGTTQPVPIKTGFAMAGDDPRRFTDHFRSAILPLPVLRDAAAGLGAINWAPDRDLIVRKVPLVTSVGYGADAQLVPGLDAEALRLAQHADTILVKASNASGATGFGRATGIVAVKIGAFEVPTESDGMVRVRYAGSMAARHIPAWRLFAGDVPRSEIDGRIVLIGASAAALSDLRSSPLEAAIPGVDVHAEVLEQIIAGAYLARPDYALGLEAILLVIGGLGAACVARFAKPIIAAGTVLWFLVLLGGAHVLAFSRAQLLFDPLMPGATWLFAYAVMTIAVYRHSERQRQFVRKAFSRYLAPALVERLAEDPTKLTLGGEAREVTVLFSDVRGFTRRCEGLSAEAVVTFLNQVHTPLTEAVLAEAGTIDKYIGDGLMAFWNAPLDVPQHASRACRAALAMQKSMTRLNTDLAAAATANGEPYQPVAIGIGINLGQVFVGNMGAEQRFDYSIVGDPVNVAARLEAATKEFDVPILVSKAVADAAAKDFLFLPLGEIDLKGRTAASNVFALHAAASGTDLDFHAFAALHQKALVATQAGTEDAAARLAEVRAHSLAKPYRRIYARLAQKLD